MDMICEPSGLSRLECKVSICDCFEHQIMDLFVPPWWSLPDKGLNVLGGECRNAPVGVPMSLDHFFFDRDGTPIDVATWARLYEDLQGRILARTQVGPHMVVTVWMGTNDELADPPNIFGSIVKTGELYHDEIRTPTEEAAMAAHLKLVSRMEARPCEHCKLPAFIDRDELVWSGEKVWHGDCWIAVETEE